jgi:hypothetical protein
MAMSSTAAFSARGHFVNLIALVEAKEALHAAMCCFPALRFVQMAATFFADAFMHIAVPRQTALRRILNYATAFGTAVVEHGAMGSRAACS